MFDNIETCKYNASPLLVAAYLHCCDWIDTFYGVPF